MRDKRIFVDAEITVLRANSNANVSNPVQKFQPVSVSSSGNRIHFAFFSVKPDENLEHSFQRPVQFRGNVRHGINLFREQQIFFFYRKNTGFFIRIEKTLKCLVSILKMCRFRPAKFRSTAQIPVFFRGSTVIFHVAGEQLEGARIIIFGSFIKKFKCLIKIFYVAVIQT